MTSLALTFVLSPLTEKDVVRNGVMNADEEWQQRHRSNGKYEQLHGSERNDGGRREALPACA